MGIHIGVDETNGERRDPLGAQALGDALQGFDINGLDDLAPGIGPFGDLEAQPPFDQDLGFAEMEVIEPGRPETTEFQDVAEPPGGDQGDTYPLALDDGVGGDGGAVGKLGDLGGGNPRFVQEGTDAVLYGAAVVIGRGENFLTPQSAVRPQENDIGEGAPDIDSQSILGHPLFSVWSVGNLRVGEIACQSNDRAAR